MEKLKPCPFCGREAASHAEGEGGSGWAGCINPLCEAQPCVEARTRAAAVVAWNRRASDEALAKAREALVQVEAACAESFKDAGTPGHHTTVDCCPLCGSSWECDEACPRHSVKQALAALKEVE